MLTDYETPEARELLDKIGWPGDEGWVLSYDPDPSYLWHWRHEHSVGILARSGHEALCLLRNHLREWLVAQEVCPPVYGTPIPKQWSVVLEPGAKICFFDYDQAILAAARATLKEADNA